MREKEKKTKVITMANQRKEKKTKVITMANQRKEKIITSYKKIK